MISFLVLPLSPRRGGRPVLVFNVFRILWSRIIFHCLLKIVPRQNVNFHDTAHCPKVPLPSRPWNGKELLLANIGTFPNNQYQLPIVLIIQLSTAPISLLIAYVPTAYCFTTHSNVYCHFFTLFRKLLAGSVLRALIVSKLTVVSATPQLAVYSCQSKPSTNLMATMKSNKAFESIRFIY